MAKRATADALRRQPATTVATVSAASRLRVEPLGDGKTRRVPGGTSRTLAGDSEYAPWPRRAARSACCCSAKAAACAALRLANGNTAAPRLVAMSTVVLN